MNVVLCHEIWQMDPPRDYPVVTHEFRGDTREQAYATYVAHLAGDAFLRGCVEDDEYIASDGTAVKCTVRWWYDDDDARMERTARAWIESRRRQPSQQTAQRRAPILPEDGPPLDGGPPRGFRPRVIEGGVTQVSRVSGRLPGHENHDPNVCDVRTG